MRIAYVQLIRRALVRTPTPTFADIQSKVSCVFGSQYVRGKAFRIRSLISRAWRVKGDLTCKMSEQVSQHLRISSPSTTAVNFTVSSRTRQPPRALILMKHTLRLIVAFYAILVTLTKYQTTLLGEVQPYVETCLQWTLLEHFLRLIIDSFEWWTLSATTVLALYLCMRRDYTG